MKSQILTIRGYSPHTGKSDETLFQIPAKFYLPSMMLSGHNAFQGAHVVSFYLEPTIKPNQAWDGELSLIGRELVPRGPILIHPDTDLVIRLETVK